MRSPVTEALIGVFLLFILLLSLVLLRIENGRPGFFPAATKKISLRKDSRIGLVTQKKNRTERKKKGERRFRPISRSDPVFADDILRTGLNSTILISLDDGTSISLDELSMVVLRSRITHARKLAFSHGAIRVDRTRSLRGGTIINLQSPRTARAPFTVRRKSLSPGERPGNAGQGEEDEVLPAPVFIDQPGKVSELIIIRKDKKGSSKKDSQ